MSDKQDGRKGGIPKNFEPIPYEYHKELELDVENLTNLGMGICRDDGWVIMVPFVLPGEKVLVRIYRNHKNYSDADLIKVLVASNDRVEPRCELFETCGGCQYQHISYVSQLASKRSQVEEVFEQLADITPKVEEVIGSPSEYNYRTKLTPHFQKPRDGKIQAIGFLRNGQRQRLVDVANCPIATDAINEALPGARMELQEGFGLRKKRKGGTLLLRDSMGGVITDPDDIAMVKVGAKTYQFKAGEFFQNNSLILPLLADYVIGEAKRDGVQYLIDAYCGVGFFSIYGSEQFDNCLGIEISDKAIVWAKTNAEINNVDNCKYLLGTASEIFNDVPFAGEETALIIDPPRKGCDQNFINQVHSYKPKRIVYVSCDPATQARDLKLLSEMSYEIERVQPFDLFPQTRHIENVVTLSLG